jgi:short subunit dehydrogenase-like uncharacterized protein
MPDKDLDVVVFGASGITGRQVAKHLADRAGQTGATWAVAGRDAEKVRRTLAEIGVEAPETIVADVTDAASLASMCERAKVVIDTVGPYTLYGEPVIEACIAGGAHYMDLTGEPPFVRRMIEGAHDRAVAAGVKIVNTSGFEALPPDLLVLLAAETARERWSEELATADLDAVLPTDTSGAKLSDMISGGTMQSLAEVLDDERAALAADPAAFVIDEGDAQKIRAVSPIAIAPRFNAQGDVIVPMIPSPLINPGVIHRTAALLAAEENRVFTPFRYREGVAIGGGTASIPLRFAGAGLIAGYQAINRAVVKAGPGIRGRLAGFLRKTLPSSGFGPTGEKMEEWTWSMTVNAKTVGGHYVRVDLEGDGQPGYLTTGKMLAEAGMLLAEDGSTPKRSGFLTPAAAIGTKEIDRFRHAGARIQISS